MSNGFWLLWIGLFIKHENAAGKRCGEPCLKWRRYGLESKVVVAKSAVHVSPRDYILGFLKKVDEPKKSCRLSLEEEYTLLH